MKKLTLVLTIALIALLSKPAAAQVITKYGDTVSSLNGIMKAYYDVVTVEKGGKVYYERDSLLHWPNVMVGSTSVSKKTSKVVFHYMSLKEYHQRSDASLAAEGFDEREISRKVEQFGAIYHVWSTYESRNTHNGPIIERGINSIEMFFDGTRFWILGWFYDGERKDNPIPAKYLER